MPRTKKTPARNTRNNPPKSPADKGSHSVERAAATPIRRTRRKRSSRALQEIRFYMKTTHQLIPKLSFSRVVRQILQNLGFGLDFRWQKAALDCLQEATESYITATLSDANLIALHAKRVTLMPRDIHLLMRLRSN